ncbi:uncharacterized protein LOC108903622 [Anoplophora glabripennis]|uniref:uncharacterized protein LOC108903622 n=1 Tax=Anoplophora glabripennis TaxID=217634 RepID=UPI00087573D8|nr:uncharacterized protein LOC108903622 [Anoplophora glabripennis]
MKILVSVLALAVFTVHADDPDVAGDVRKAIEKILEEITDPIIDVHDKKYTVTLPLEKLEFNLVDFVVKGVKDLDIKQLDYDSSTKRLDFDLTLAKIETYADLDVVLSGIINGDHHPTAKIDLIDLNLAGYAVVDTTVEPNQLTDFKFLTTISGSKAELTNIINDDEVTEELTKVLNEQLPTIVQNVAVILEPAASPIVQSFINIILRHIE